MALSKIDVSKMITGVTPLANGGTGGTSIPATNLASGVTGTLPVGSGGTGITSGTTDQFLKFTGTTTVASSAVSAGKIAQVIWAEMDVDTNIASGSFTALTGGAETLQATITPSAASSKVWITYTIQASMDSNRGFTSQINRNASAIYGPSNEKDTYGDGNVHQQRSTITYLDSPNSTSALVYQIKVKTDGAQNTNFAKDNSPCMITLMEVLA